MGNLSAHFSSSEFACPCCGKVKVDKNLVNLLEKLRAHWGRPIHINSGYRCARHNAEVGGVANSQHRTGKAADITINGILPSTVYATANVDNKYGGVGKYNSFVHVDTRGYWSRWNG